MLRHPDHVGGLWRRTLYILEDGKMFEGELIMNISWPTTSVMNGIGTARVPGEALRSRLEAMIEPLRFRSLQGRRHWCLGWQSHRTYSAIWISLVADMQV